MKKKVYLDHAASTPMRPQALEMLSQASQLAFANPSAQHPMGEQVASKIEQARAHFLDVLDAGDEYSLIFLSSATEANNWIIRDLAPRFKSRWASEADHPSTVAPLRSHGFENYSLSDIESAADNASEAFFNCTFVNSFSGTVLDIAKIRSLLGRDSHLHVDAVQGFGKLPFSLRKWQADSVTITAHKMGGPRGIAALVFKKDLTLSPLLLGGAHEASLRASTPATALILSWAAALDANLESSLSSARDLQNHLKLMLQQQVDDIQFVTTQESLASPYITTVVIPGLPSDLIVRHLGEYGIAVSSSSACSSRSKGFSPAFAALGIPEKNHKSVLRISTGHNSTHAEIDFFCQKLETVLSSLRS